jgi:hypothetical protein
MSTALLNGVQKYFLQIPQGTSAKAVKFPTFIREVFGSIIGRDTDYHDEVLLSYSR